MYLRLKYVITFVILSTVVVLVVVLGLVWSMPDLPGSIGRSICLPGLLTDGSRSETLRCGDMADMLQTYLQTATDLEYNRVQANDIKARKLLEKERRLSLQGETGYHFETIPAARLVGTTLPESRPGDKNVTLVPIRAWRHDRHNHQGGFIRHGIQYRNGRLTVPVSGTYNVYSFLDMRETWYPQTEVPSKAQATIQHSIFKFNIKDGLETELISSVQPHLVSTTRLQNVYSSYLASIVELKRGDELAVKCSNLSYLQSPIHNYFGVHLL